MAQAVGQAVFGAFADNVDVRTATRAAMTDARMLNTSVDLVLFTRVSLANASGVQSSADFADWQQITGDGAFWRPASYRAQVGLPPLPSPTTMFGLKRAMGSSGAPRAAMRALRSAKLASDASRIG